LALEGLSSGESIVADDKYWQDKRARLIDHHLAPKRRTGVQR
jgi:hypothetical protein